MPTQLYAVSGSPGPNLSGMRTGLLTQIRTEMHAFHEQLLTQLQTNLAGLTTVLNQEVCALRAEMQQEIGMRAEIQLELQKYQQELQDLRAYAEKKREKAPRPPPIVTRAAVHRIRSPSGVPRSNGHVGGAECCGPRVKVCFSCSLMLLLIVACWLLGS